MLLVNPCEWRISACRGAKCHFTWWEAPSKSINKFSGLGVAMTLADCNCQCLAQIELCQIEHQVCGSAIPSTSLYLWCASYVPKQRVDILLRARCIDDYKHSKKKRQPHYNSQEDTFFLEVCNTTASPRHHVFENVGNRLQDPWSWKMKPTKNHCALGKSQGAPATKLWEMREWKGCMYSIWCICI